MGVVVAMAVVGGCKYESSDDGSGAVDSSTPQARPVFADGTGTDVCGAAEASARVLADEAFDIEGVRWVFCAGVDGVLSVRSVRPGEWEAKQLPISAEASVAVTVSDAGRAWVTHDGDVSGEHEHAWTIDGGVRWTRLIVGD